MVNVAMATGLTASEIAGLTLSLAHLGGDPQGDAARSGLRHALSGLDLGDDVIATTLNTLTRPLDADTARRAGVIAHAITDRKVLGVIYSDAADRVTVRDVEPVTCLVHRDHWYLVGWCRLRRDIRAFRFDRLLAVEPANITTPPHDVADFLPFQRRGGSKVRGR